MLRAANHSKKGKMEMQVTIETDSSDDSDSSDAESDVSMKTIRRRIHERNIKARLLPYDSDSSDEDPGDVPVKSVGSIKEEKIAAVKQEVKDESSEMLPGAIPHFTDSSAQLDDQHIASQVGSIKEEKIAAMKQEVKDESSEMLPSATRHFTNTPALLDDQHIANQDNVPRKDNPRKEGDNQLKRDTPLIGDTPKKVGGHRKEDSPSSKVSKIERLLLEASRKGDIENVENLLKHKANVNAKDKSGQTPLIKACSCGHEEMVELLLKNGAQVNEVDQWEYSPLHEAAAKDHRAIFKLLLKYGADCGLKNIYGDRPHDLLKAKAMAPASAKITATSTTSASEKATTPAKPAVGVGTTAVKANILAKHAFVTATRIVKSTNQAKPLGSSVTTTIKATTSSKPVVQSELTAAKHAVATVTTVIKGSTPAKPVAASKTTAAKPALATVTTAIKAFTPAKPVAAAKTTAAKPALATVTTAIKAFTPAKPVAASETTAAKPALATVTTAIKAFTPAKPVAAPKTTAAKPAVATMTTAIKAFTPAKPVAAPKITAAKPMETDEEKGDEEKMEQDYNMDTKDPTAPKYKHLANPPEFSMGPSLLTISQKNPVVHLNELRQKRVKYSFVSASGEEHHKQFTMKVTVDGQEFEGAGWNKKSAKIEAAKSALNKIFNILTVPSSALVTRSKMQQRQQTVTHETTAVRERVPCFKEGVYTERMTTCVGSLNDGSKSTRNEEKHGVNRKCIPSLLDLETHFIQTSTVTRPNRKRCNNEKSLDLHVHFHDTGKRRCITSENEPRSMLPCVQDQTTSSTDELYERASEVKSACQKLRGNTSETKTVHNLGQDTSAQRHKINVKPAYNQGQDTSVQRHTTNVHGIEAFTSLNVLRPVDGSENETKLDSAHDGRSNKPSCKHSTNENERTSNQNQNAYGSKEKNNSADRNKQVAGNTETKSGSVNKQDQNKNKTKLNTPERKRDSTTAGTCPCGAKKNRCRKWKKSKKVFNTKKIMVKGLEANETDIYKMFEAKKIQLKKEKISGKPFAHIWFDTEKDCHDALKNHQRNHSLVLKLAIASKEDMKEEKVSLHDLKVQERKKGRHYYY